MTEQGPIANVPPRPETEQFSVEIASPVRFDVGGVSYGVFLLNQKLAADGVNPAIINFAYGEEGSVGPGRFDLNAFAQTINRPLVAIDMAGMGESRWLSRSARRNATFDSLAENHLHILDQLGIDHFDLIGNSMGAIMATKIAVLAGERADRLITFSSPGFEARPPLTMALRDGRQNMKDFQAARTSAPIEVQEERVAALSHKRNKHLETRVRGAQTTLKYGRLLTRFALRDVQTQLSPSTKWVDVIGARDAFSDSRAHVRAVEERNRLNPGMSSVNVLERASHAWQAYYRWDVAAFAASVLDS